MDVDLAPEQQRAQGFVVQAVESLRPSGTGTSAGRGHKSSFPSIRSAVGRASNGR
jgi:hypothetical protein